MFKAVVKKQILFEVSEHETCFWTSNYHILYAIAWGRRNITHCSRWSQTLTWCLWSSLNSIGCIYEANGIRVNANRYGSCLATDWQWEVFYCTIVPRYLLTFYKWINPYHKLTADEKKDDATLCLIYNAEVFQSVGLCNVKNSVPEPLCDLIVGCSIFPDRLDHRAAFLRAISFY